MTEKRLRFLGGKAQVRRAQLAQPLPHPPQGQGPGRINASEDDEVHRGRQMPHQAYEQLCTASDRTA